MADPDPVQFAAALREKAALLARRAAASADASPKSLRGLMELTRQAGHLEETGFLADRLAAMAPDDCRAVLLADILQRRPRRPEAVGPAPFVRLMDFLDEDVRGQIDALIDAAMPEFNPAQIYNDGDGSRTVETARVSLVLNNTRPLAEVFLPLIKAAVEKHHVLEVLGVEIEGKRRYELEATVHGDGAFFATHTDNGSAKFRPRAISFVYYFHTRPKAFTGGDLLLFDGQAEPDQLARDAFTRILPVDNSLIFFPSGAKHEVEPVRMPQGAARDGRFTLNGWIRRPEA